MHGESGAGKSTIARGLGQHLGAVVLDKDLFKDPGHHLELPGSVCGPYAYEALFSVADDIMAQGAGRCSSTVQPGGQTSSVAAEGWQKTMPRRT